MQLNEWKEKDDAEQRFLIHKQLVLANDWLRQIHAASRKAAEDAAKRAGTAGKDSPPRTGPEAH